jgi:large subunit ribosomal protein L29
VKAAKWRDLSDDEMRQRLQELREELFNLRFQLSMGVAKNPARVGQARRDLARAYTLLRERGVRGPVITIAAPSTARPSRPARERRSSTKKAAPTATTRPGRGQAGAARGPGKAAGTRKGAASARKGASGAQKG